MRRTVAVAVDVLAVAVIFVAVRIPSAGGVAVAIAAVVVIFVVVRSPTASGVAVAVAVVGTIAVPVDRRRCLGNAPASMTAEAATGLACKTYVRV